MHFLNKISLTKKTEEINQYRISSQIIKKLISLNTEGIIFKLSELYFYRGVYKFYLNNYDKAIEAFKEARVLFKRNKEVIHVARCDQKMASCLIELGQGELALETARKAVDVFETGHDHRRETFASFEFGKAQILLEKYDDGLATLENVLAIVSEDEPKDFEFIVDVESRIAKILRMQGRVEEADEIERRLKTVLEALEDEPELDLLT